MPPKGPDDCDQQSGEFQACIDLESVAGPVVRSRRLVPHRDIARQLCLVKNIHHAADVIDIIPRALKNVIDLGDRMTVFFRDMFYTGNKLQAAEIEFIKKISHDLEHGGVKTDDCFVARMTSDGKELRDEFVMSTPQGLVVFNCEPQANSGQVSPQHPELKLIDPLLGLVIRPNGDAKDSSLGAMEFKHSGLRESEGLRNVWNGRDVAALSKHRSMWKIPQDPDVLRQTRHVVYALIYNLLEQDPGHRGDCAQIMLRKLHAIADILEEGLGCINDLYESAPKDQSIDFFDEARY